MPALRAVLGIDAAWSDQHPSAVALVAENGERWRCVALAPSYQEFLALSRGQGFNWQAKRKGAFANPGALLQAAHRFLGGNRVTVVALDIPLATTPIKGRRQADNLVSSEYGSRGCSTHSPGRPELRKVSRQLRDGFTRAGFPLVTASKRPVRSRSMIEVFPHPALLALLCETYRIPYKVSRERSYWPKCSPQERKLNLLEQFRRILNALQREISAIPLTLPSSSVDGLPRAELKAYEDSLDALLCAWVGIKYAKREVRSFGDETAAIWVPI